MDTSQASMRAASNYHNSGRQSLPERWEAGAECASVDYFTVLHTEERRQLTAGSRELTTEIGVVWFCLLRLGETAVYRF